MSPEARFVKLKVKGPSSVAFHAARETVLVASDDGYVAELDRSLKKLKRYKTKGDLEGIAVNAATGRVLLASEREGAILELDLDDERVVRTMVIDFESHPELESVKGDNRGIEGLALVPTSAAEYRLFAVLQADPARLLELSHDVEGGDRLSKKMRKRVRDRAEFGKKRRGKFETLRVESVVQLDLKPLSDVVFAPTLGALVVVSSETKRALLYELEQSRVVGQFRLPGKKPEGLAILPGGELLVVDDEGGAWWIDDAESWIAANSI